MKQNNGLIPSLKFSHIGLFARDVDEQANFYQSVLGFTETDRGTLQTQDGVARLVFLSRDPDEHHQIVLVSGRPSDEHFNVVNQISMKAGSLKELQILYQQLKAQSVSGLVAVTHGNAISLYCRDPEGNRLELYVDTPWYVSQPCRVEAPIELPTGQLLEWAERHARGLEGFRPRAQWRAEMAIRMNAAATPVL